MGRAELSDPLASDDWDAKYEEFKSLRRALEFSELVDLARTILERRIAFDANYQIGMNRMSKVGYYRQETLSCTGSILIF
jgi:hypothetical protein